MKILNNKIFEYSNKLQIFKECNIKMPIRINFYLQKNIQLIQEAALEINKARVDIGSQFGEPNNDGSGYIVPSERMAEAAAELNDLLNLEQDINLHIFKLDDFDGIDLTFQELSAIMFMIEE